MNIGFCNGVFHKITEKDLDRFLPSFIKKFELKGANTLELIILNEDSLDFLIDNLNKNDYSYFSSLSLHAPSFKHNDISESIRILEKMEKVVNVLDIKNIVIHPDAVSYWEVFEQFKHLPLSIENQDGRKNFGNTLEDIKSILDKYKFLNLTLDLQHCFVNDPSMQLAQDFHKEFGDRVVEYHLSAYDKELNHVQLFKKEQLEIIKSLELKDKRIVIESVLEDFGEEKKELEYILNNFK